MNHSKKFACRFGNDVRCKMIAYSHTISNRRTCYESLMTFFGQSAFIEKAIHYSKTLTIHNNKNSKTWKWEKSPTPPFLLAAEFYQRFGDIIINLVWSSTLTREKTNIHAKISSFASLEKSVDCFNSTLW